MSNLKHRTAHFITIVLAALVLSALAPALPAAAHPLGNFSINQYNRLEVESDAVRMTYVLDLAELPTIADRQLLDRDGDGATTPAEQDAYVASKLAEIAPFWQLSVAGSPLPLTLQQSTISFPEGQAGLATTRIEATYLATLPTTARAGGEIAFRNNYAPERIGWREIVVINGADIRLDNAAILATDQSDALRTYPSDLLSSPLDERATTVAFRAAAGVPALEATAPTSEPLGFDLSARLSALVNGATASTSGMLLALLAAAIWGAVHALSPGHGKSVVAAYLVGSRGTARHAVFLGLTVTITHTAGVLALGAVLLFASRTIVPESLYPWLSLSSGAMVVAVGMTILRQRIWGAGGVAHHHGDIPSSGLTHTHGGTTHSHMPPTTPNQRLSWRNLLALGISGGLLPCPSALLALLGAVAVGRAGFGLLVVIAFSLGLAATLTAIGLIFLHASQLLERRAITGRFPGIVRFAPAAAALAVTLSGALIVARAVVELRLL